MSAPAARPAALVTGADRGIGRSTALLLGRHGFDVAVNYQRSRDAAQAVAAALEAGENRVLLCPADVSDETAVRRMATEVEASVGRLDGLVNNAGTTIDTPPRDLKGLGLANWDRVFAVNLRRVFQVTRAVDPLLRRSPSAAVVELASIAGLRPAAQPFPYAASKAAVANLTRTLAGALGPEIRVNAVAPGWMVGEWMAEALGDNYERLMERRARLTPLHRCVTPTTSPRASWPCWSATASSQERSSWSTAASRPRPEVSQPQAPLDGVVPHPPEVARRYRARGYWRDQTLDPVFSACLETHAARVAVRWGDEAISYTELGRRAARLAAWLHQLGLRRSDRVVVHLPNCPEFLILYFACQRLGVIPILALAPHRRHEIDHFVGLADAVAYFGTDPELGAQVQAAHPSLRHLVMRESLQDAEVGRALVAAGAWLRPPAVAVDPDDPCVLLLSGGTTGIPKLIPRSHNDYLYNTRAAMAVQAIAADSVQLCVLPLAHNMPLACPGVQRFLLAGAACVLGASTRAEEVYWRLERHRVSHIAAVPALYLRWLADPAAQGRDTSSVRLLQSGGQRLQPEVRRRLAEAFPQAFVQENVGMGEGTLCFTRADDPEPVRLETVGTPVSPDDEVRLTDEAGGEVADEEVGELTVRGPYTLRGCYRVPEYNARVFTPDGFYRSGDLTRRHPSGAFLVEGRIKDLVNRGGEKISCEEVENLILTHPAVRNVACLATPDPALGERMCACVILDCQGLTLDGLCAHLLQLGVAKYTLPERLEVVDRFPLSPFGKVAKQALLRQLPAVTGS